MIAGLDKREVDGFMTYTRPEGKSGGHGVGWSEIPKYTFKVPQGWQETPVSIADLGGTEVGHPALSCTLCRCIRCHCALHRQLWHILLRFWDHLRCACTGWCLPCALSLSLILANTETPAQTACRAMTLSVI